VPFFHIKARWAPYFSNQKTLGAIFARILKEFAQNFQDFVKIFIDFAQLFAKSKLSGMRLHPRLLHHWIQCM